MSIHPIFVYDDAGVDHQSPQGFIDGFAEIGIKVERISAEILRESGWEERTRAIVFGAGTASIWDESLGAQGRRNIRNYVTHYGGSYIGICCGAMFASAQSEFGSIIKKRGLDFFPGKTIGPIYPTDNYRDLSSVWAEKIAFTFDDTPILGSLYTQGGCYFESLLDDRNVQIVATYKNSRPAAVFCKAGLGKAFLMGPHIEFSPEPLYTIQDTRIQKVAEKLRRHEPFRRTIFKEIASILKLV